MIRAILLLLFLPFFLASLALSGLRIVTLSAPDAVSRIAWIDPDMDLTAHRQLLRDTIDPELPYLVSPRHQKHLARLSPLDTLPYMPLLISASADRDLEAMQVLSEHVLRLDPRNRAARFVSAQLAVTRGQSDEAMAALVPLVTLDRSNAQIYIQEMAALAATADGRETLLATLSKAPGWGGSLVRQLAATSTDTDFLFRLFELYPEGQSSFVQALARRGELERAHLTFLNFLSADQIQQVSAPFDGQFQGLAGAQPFNWVINKSYAGFENGGGLFASFFGQGRPMIAEQLVRLSPGPYRARFVMSGQVFQNGGHFAWTIGCTRSGETLLTRPIVELLSSNTEYDAGFTVPDTGCRFQTLRLTGVAGAFPRTSRAIITSVEITSERGS